MSQRSVETIALPVAAHSDHPTPLDSVALQQEWLDLMVGLDGDGISHEQGDAYLVAANALYRGAPAQWSFVPKLFSERDMGYLAWIAETMGRIMDKVTRAYQADSEIRAAFGFSKELEELTLAPVGYETQIPIARVDIFLNEETGDFEFCELNTDGSSGMLWTMEVTEANARTQTGRLFAEAHPLKAFDIYRACAQTVLDCYREAGGTSAHPVIAAVDYAESVAMTEIEKYIDVFARMGVELRFADIRDLSYQRGVLRDARGPIDCVWRRVVISEMLEKPCEGVDAFKACVLDGRVPMVGAFRTWPCATKTIFALFHSELMERYLDADELAFVRKHVPATYMVDERTDLSLFSDKDRWIAKPRDGFNSAGVRAGSECTDEEWVDVLAEMVETGGTVQAYAPQYHTMTVEGGTAGIGRRPAPYANMEGLYLLGNRFAGVFTRCGTSAVIGATTGRLNMGCFLVER